MCRGAPRGKALPRPMLPALRGAAALGLGGAGPAATVQPCLGAGPQWDFVHHTNQGMPSDHTGVLWKPGWRRYGVLPHAWVIRNTWIELELCFHVQVTDEQLKQQQNAFARVMQVPCHRQLPNQSSPPCWHGAVTTPGTGTPRWQGTEAPGCASLLQKGCWLAGRHQTRFLHPSSFKPYTDLSPWCLVKPNQLSAAI